MDDRWARIFLRAMAGYWTIFGLITIFAPSLMGMFQTPVGLAARTEFSDHVWQHDGLDILAVAVLVFATSMATISRGMLIGAGIAALLPTIGIGNSLVATSYWSMLFMVPFLGCIGFAIWGIVLASRYGAAVSPPQHGPFAHLAGGVFIVSHDSPSILWRWSHQSLQDAQRGTVRVATR